MQVPDIIIAIDGYSSTGKSSFAKIIAKEFSFLYLDSGALYRGVTLFAIENGFISEDCTIDVPGLDKAMAELFVRRMHAAEAVAQYKKERGLAILDEAREAEVVRRNSAFVEDETLREYYINFLRENMSISRAYQSRLLEGMKIAFIYGESNEYQIISENGKEYTSVEAGEYHWGEYNSEENTLTLTLKNKDGDTVWNITDADKNAAGHDWYIDEILTGLALPREEVLTKDSPAVIYPTLFKFTDTKNPKRYFITGSGRSSANIKYNFN